MDSKKAEKLRKLLNKRFSQNLEYKNRETNPTFIVTYKLLFSISRKVNLNCYIQITGVDVVDPKFIHIMKWQVIINHVKIDVMRVMDKELMKFLGVTNEVINEYFIKRDKEVIIKLSEMKKKVLGTSRPIVKLNLVD
jgi:hypothetical protein